MSYISYVIPIRVVFCESENVEDMEKIQPEKAVEILARHGTHVTVEEAQLILDFMYDLANIALNIYIEDQFAFREKIQ